MFEFTAEGMSFLVLCIGALFYFYGKQRFDAGVLSSVDEMIQLNLIERKPTSSGKYIFVSVGNQNRECVKCGHYGGYETPESS